MALILISISNRAEFLNFIADGFERLSDNPEAPLRGTEGESGRATGAVCEHTCKLPSVAHCSPE